MKINLDNEQGNSFHLLATAKKLSVVHGLNYPIIEAEMKETDYDNLLQVFVKYFGEFVDFETEDAHILNLI